MIAHKRTKSASGQGALEYLLLIGGAVLVATIILVIVIGGVFPSTGNIVNDNIDAYENRINLNTALGGGGGGPGPTCGNSALDSGEDCDGALLNGNDCTTVPGSFTGGTLGCTASCTFDTSACTSPVPDTSGPSISAFSTNITGAGAGNVEVSYAATDATTPITYTLAYSSTPGLVGGMVAADFDAPPVGVTTTPTSGGLAVVGGLTPGTTYEFGLRACDSVSPTPNCSVSSVVADTPYISFMFEAESATTVQAGLNNSGFDPTNSMPVMMEFDSPTCVTNTNDRALWPVEASIPAGSHTWKGWALAYTDETTANMLVSISSFSSVLSIPSSSDFDWFTGSSFTVNGNVPNIRINCGIDGRFTYVDKVLWTTDLACVPVGDGSNCI